MNATKSVEEIMSLIERYQLMSSKDLAAMRGRWNRAGRKDAADPDQFRKWLVLNRYLTDFVVKVLSGGNSEQLVLNQYRLTDQLIAGPMAGAYLAIDPLDRRVAIEVLSSSSASDKSVLTAFQLAAFKSINVQHPNVGQVLDAGQAHGLHYLVREYYEGQTLREILERRGKLPYVQATRLMSMALSGVEALHSKGVFAGELTADSLLLTPVVGGAPNQRTLKILHAGVKRRLFDESAIGRSISVVPGIPDKLELARSSTFEVATTDAPNPAEDIFKLGCVFYRAVVGQPPYSEHDLPRPSTRAQPVCQANPEIPDMLGQIIDEMIDPAPASRPKNAGHVVKSLHVFLSADEHGREAKAEEEFTVPKNPIPARSEALKSSEEQIDDEQSDESDETAGPKGAAVENEGVKGKFLALWEELRPATRDLVFLAGGAFGALLLILIGHLLTGIRLAYVAGLITGAAASYFVEMLLRWRQHKNAELSPDPDNVPQ